MGTTYTGAPAGPFAAFGRLAGPTHALLRIGAGLLFMQHGAQKLFGALGGMDGQGAKVGNLMSQMGAAGILEFFGGLLIVIGLATRPVAALLFIQMLVAYFQAHMPQGGMPVQNGGELALLYALAWAFFAGNGAGPLSVDAALARRRGPGRNS
jgi:putative oxidoreductase